MPRWRVDIIRKRAEHLGTVEAATEKEAIEKAADRCGKCNMPRREWDESRGTAKCQGETVGRGPNRREVKQGVGKVD
jgi:hypothetical protein